MKFILPGTPNVPLISTEKWTIKIYQIRILYFRKEKKMKENTNHSVGPTETTPTEKWPGNKKKDEYNWNKRFTVLVVCMNFQSVT